MLAIIVRVRVRVLILCGSDLDSGLRPVHLEVSSTVLMFSPPRRCNVTYFSDSDRSYQRIVFVFLQVRLSVFVIFLFFIIALSQTVRFLFADCSLGKYGYYHYRSRSRSRLGSLNIVGSIPTIAALTPGDTPIGIRVW